MKRPEEEENGQRMKCVCSCDGESRGTEASSTIPTKTSEVQSWPCPGCGIQSPPVPYFSLDSKDTNHQAIRLTFVE